MKRGVTENEFENDFRKFAVDSRVRYPSYKSLDEFIDVAALRELDGYVTERIRRHIETRREDFFLNLHRLEKNTPYQPGVREIWLSRTAPYAPAEYLDLVDEAALWRETETAQDFRLLTDFIKTLPFAATGRMLIIYDDAGKSVPAHRDHLDAEKCSEFIWLRTNYNKSLYFLNQETGAKSYLEGYTAWFDSVNQYHGCDGCEGLSFSIRVDGKFTDEFRGRIPQPPVNAASTPSYWASFE